MSVVIKGIKIPESCLDCPIYDHYNYHCNLYGYGIPARYNYDPSKRPEWCELEGLPEHHGRLIDADAFAERIKSIIERQGYNDLAIGKFLTVGEVLNAVIDDLKGMALYDYENTPTIIEAE